DGKSEPVRSTQETRTRRTIFAPRPRGRYPISHPAGPLDPCFDCTIRDPLNRHEKGPVELRPTANIHTIGLRGNTAVPRPDPVIEVGVGIADTTQRQIRHDPDLVIRDVDPILDHVTGL